MSDAQLTFELPLRAALGRSDFFQAESNADALAAVEGWRDWAHGCLLLTGPSGAGKTHLAHVFGAACPGAAIIAAADLHGADIPALAARPGIAVEDADRIAGDITAETALFHLYNLTHAERGHLLVTAAAPPRDWGLTLPDLKSRMQATPMARLDAPCDALLAAVLVKLFADRQIAVQPALIGWLLARIERSFAAAGAVVARLDAAALARRQPVTRSLAAAVIGLSLDSGDAKGDDD